MRAIRVLLICLTLPVTGRADDAATETVIRLKVSPMAAPKPALRYQLLPELREMQSGNPIYAYSICFMEQHNFYQNKEALENREKWQTMPLKDLPYKEILSSYNGKSIRQADYAARLDTPDWQILYKIRRDGVALLLPDLQPLRSLAGVLKVRLRAEIASGDINAAIGTTKTLLALSRHLGEHPTLIGNLVGIAVANIALGPVDELIQQPGCPNLYWALTNLPKPMFDLRKGLQGERCLFDAEFALLDQTEPMTERQILAAVAKLHETMRGIFGPQGPKIDVSGWLAKRTADEAFVSSARARLKEYGVSEEKLKLFPPQQFVLLEEMIELQIQRDEVAKAMSLPFWEGAKLMESASARRDESRLLDGLAPSVKNVRQAAARLEQRVALLRCVEALRLYAASKGQLPDKLEDCTVPIPADPITGKAFRYQLDGTKAILRGTPPKGMETNPSYNVLYEVTITK